MTLTRSFHAPMPKFATILLFVVAGYLVAAIIGYFLISALSNNQHDKAMEAAMTSAFVTGPLGAIIAGVIGFMRTRG